MQSIIDALAKLLSIKCLMAIGMTVVFCYLSCVEKVTPEFTTVYACVITFYFGSDIQRGVL